MPDATARLAKRDALLNFIGSLSVGGKTVLKKISPSSRLLARSAKFFPLVVSPGRSEPARTGGSYTDAIAFAIELIFGQKPRICSGQFGNMDLSLIDQTKATRFS